MESSCVMLVALLASLLPEAVGALLRQPSSVPFGEVARLGEAVEADWHMLRNTGQLDDVEDLPREVEPSAGTMAGSEERKIIPLMPTEVGCYVWAPSGCPRNPSYTLAKTWVRDQWGEVNADASRNRTACEGVRKQAWEQWCGARDVEVRLVVESPALPEDSGCYVWAPSGCTRRPWFKTETWTRDHFGEEEMFAAANQSICETWRRQQYNQYCGVNDIRVVFVADLEGQTLIGKKTRRPAAPMEPGCYVWTPLGCPRRPQFTASKGWARDEHGEANTDAATNQITCEVTRAFSYTEWCGQVEVHMTFVPQAVHQAENPQSNQTVEDEWAALVQSGEIDEIFTKQSALSADGKARPRVPAMPTKPGCYVWSPSGCPRSPDSRLARAWTHDIWGEANIGASSNRTACEMVRKENWANWCGAHDLEVRLVVASPPPPTEPGCYVWAPSACSRRPWFKTPTWTHDTFGETRMFASANKSVCEFWRKEQYNYYCGVRDVRTFFIPQETSHEAFLAKHRPPAPTQPGCYVWTPMGCPRRPRFNASFEWQGVSGSRCGASRPFPLDEAACKEACRRKYSDWCSHAEVHMTFIPSDDQRKEAGLFRERLAADWGDYLRSQPSSQEGASDVVGFLTPQDVNALAQKPKQKQPPLIPTTVGCYVWSPGACPRNPSFHIARTWVRDDWGEAHLDAAHNRTACETVRKQNWVNWCGEPEVQVRMIVESPEAPKEPGCYMWTPSPCEKRPWFKTPTWIHDSFGEENMYAGANKSICEKWRREQFNTYCGIDDFQAMFVPASEKEQQSFLSRHRPATPEEPGCYVWTPQGCPRRPQFNASSDWQRDKKRGVDREACEQTRLKEYSAFCGGTLVVTTFIASAEDLKQEQLKKDRLLVAEWSDYVQNERFEDNDEFADPRG